MAETYINAQRQARLYAQDFLAANPKQQAAIVSHGGVRVRLDRAGDEQVQRVCTGCAHDIREGCAAQFPPEPCFTARAAA